MKKLTKPNRPRQRDLRANPITEANIRAIGLGVENTKRILTTVWVLTDKQVESLLKKEIIGVKREWFLNHPAVKDPDKLANDPLLYEEWELALRDHFGEDLINNINKSHNKNLSKQNA